MPEECHNGDQCESPCYGNSHVGPSNVIQLCLCHVNCEKEKKRVMKIEELTRQKRTKAAEWKQNPQTTRILSRFIISSWIWWTTTDHCWKYGTRSKSHVDSCWKRVVSLQGGWDVTNDHHRGPWSENVGSKLVEHPQFCMFDRRVQVDSSHAGTQQHNSSWRISRIQYNNAFRWRVEKIQRLSWFVQ